jgi:hypothetical protein
MDEYPFTLDQVIAWIRSMDGLLAERGIILAGIKTNERHKPSVVADFDSEGALGRISAWVSGELVFEVLSRQTGEFIHFQHEHLTNTTARSSYREFVNQMRLPPTSPSAAAAT